MLGNPRVKLVHHVDGRDVVVRTAPTAADIAGLNEDYYLDLPGDPLSRRCAYAKDYADLKANGRAPATTYAHIARETGHSGLVVQYFFFYYFNQFNDVHEGDWEGMQIAFDADTPAQALADGPSEIALFQHGGGERADWDAAKVQKENTPTRSSIRRLARTPPSTTMRSTSRTGRTARASVATTAPSR